MSRHASWAVAPKPSSPPMARSRIRYFGGGILAVEGTSTACRFARN